MHPSTPAEARSFSDDAEWSADDELEYFSSIVRRDLSRVMGRSAGKNAVLENRQRHTYVDLGHTNVAFSRGVVKFFTQDIIPHVRTPLLPGGIGQCSEVAFVRIRRSR